MNTLPQQLANGLLLGSMYGLIAIGYTMVYGIVQLINFAHGEIFMTGAFGAFTVYFYILPDGVSMAVAVPLMLVGGGIVAIVPGRCEVCVWSPGLDARGNSVAGVAALDRFTTLTGWSVF